MIKQRINQTPLGSGTLTAVNLSDSLDWGAIPPNGQAVVATQTFPEFDSYFEIVQDESPGGRRFGRCYHDKVEVIRTGAEPLHYQGVVPVNTDHAYKWTHNMYAGQCLTKIDQFQNPTYSSDVWTYALGSVFSPTRWDTYDWSAFSSRALVAMLPSLEDGFSILNFVYELRDFRTLFKSVIGKFGLRKGVGWKQLFKAAAGAHLTYQFAVAPFLSDLEKIFDRIYNFSADVNSFLEKSGKPQTRHYVEDDEISLNNYAATDSSVAAWVLRPVGPAKISRHATMRYVYTVPSQIPDFMKYVLGFMARLGINPARPSIVWNAIPFTFLVDWIVDVGDLLDSQSAKEVLPVNTKILDFCCSQKFKSIVNLGLELSPEHSAIAGQPGPAFTFIVDKYQRERIIPYYSSALALAHPKLKQLTLATSLLVALSGKRKR